MVDHNQRITARMHEMERSVEPLAIMIVVLMVLLLANAAIEAYAAYLYKSQINAARAFASCLNGQVVDTGESVIRCNVQNSQLVAGLSK